MRKIISIAKTIAETVKIEVDGRIYQRVTDENSDPVVFWYDFGDVDDDDFFSDIMDSDEMAAKTPELEDIYIKLLRERKLNRIL